MIPPGAAWNRNSGGPLPYLRRLKPGFCLRRMRLVNASEIREKFASQVVASTGVKP